MSQSFNCLPTSLWQFDPATPKGYYFNRGVFYFGKKVENDMAQAEAEIRKSHKNNSGTDRLVTAARIRALEKNIGIELKKHRDPGQVPLESEPGQHNEDEVVFLSEES